MWTDVTIEGTPYLTVRIFQELSSAFLSRTVGSLGDVRRGNILNPPSGGNALTSMVNFPNEGNIIGSDLETYRSHASNLYRNWVNEIPYPYAGTFNQYAGVGVLHTQSEYFQLAGISPYGFRKAFSYDPLVNDWRNFDDPMYDGNYSFDNTLVRGTFVIVGEIMGPWLIDDIQKLAEFAQWTMSRSDGLLTAYNWLLVKEPDWRYRGYQGFGTTDLPTVKSLAEAAWTPTPTSAVGILMLAELNWTQDQYTSNLISQTGQAFKYGLSDRGIEENSPLWMFGGVCKMWGWSRSAANPPEYQYDDNGTGLVQNSFNHIKDYTIPANTIIATEDTTDHLVFHDSSIRPNWPAGDPKPTRIEPTRQGFMIDLSSRNTQMWFRPNHGFWSGFLPPPPP